VRSTPTPVDVDGICRDLYFLQASCYGVQEFAREWKHCHLQRQILKCRSSAASSCCPSHLQYTQQHQSLCTLILNKSRVHGLVVAANFRSICWTPHSANYSDIFASTLMDVLQDTGKFRQPGTLGLFLSNRDHSVSLKC
jgi:hypothetical protein